MKTARQSLLMDLPRSRPRRSLGHVIDAGDNDLPARMIWAKLKCSKGHVFEVCGGYTITQLKRGLPCPVCNSSGDTP